MTGEAADESFCLEWYKYSTYWVREEKFESVPVPTCLLKMC